MRTYYGYTECLVCLAADLGCICLHKNKQTKKLYSFSLLWKPITRKLKNMTPSTHRMWESPWLLQACHWNSQEGNASTEQTRSLYWIQIPYRIRSWIATKRPWEMSIAELFRSTKLPLKKMFLTNLCNRHRCTNQSICPKSWQKPELE